MNSKNLSPPTAEAVKKQFDKMDLVFTVLPRGLGDIVQN